MKPFKLEKGTQGLFLLPELEKSGDREVVKVYTDPKSKQKGQVVKSWQKAEVIKATKQPDGAYIVKLVAAAGKPWSAHITEAEFSPAEEKKPADPKGGPSAKASEGDYTRMALGTLQDICKRRKIDYPEDGVPETLVDLLKADDAKTSGGE